MSSKCNYEYESYCSSCVVQDCEYRKKNVKESLVNLECDGNCSLCDAAFSHHSIISDKITCYIHTCILYHVQTHHDVDFIKRIGEISSKSEIELINSRISKCDTCFYSPICTLISKNADWTVHDVKAHLKINWNFHNEKILDYIPKDKLYAFTICEELQAQFKALQIKSLQDYIKQLSKT